MKFLIGRDLGAKLITNPVSAFESWVNLWLPQLRVYSFRNGFQGWLTLPFAGTLFQDSSLPRQYFWFLNLLFPLAMARIAYTNLRLKSWFVIPFLFMFIPVYWLHARTAFEYVLGAGFFWLGISFAWQHLQSPFPIRYRNFAILSWGAAQGTYHAYQGGVIVVTLLFLVACFLIRKRQRVSLQITRSFLLSVLLLAWVFGPLLYHYLKYWNLIYQDIQIRSSSDGKMHLFRNLFQLISPRFWFFETESPLIRHHLSGFPRASFLILILSIVSLFQKSNHRLWLILLGLTILGHLSVLLTEVHVFRSLGVLALWIVTAAVGLEWMLTRFQRYQLRFSVFSGVVVLALFFQFQVLNAGIRWKSNRLDDYGLYGVQYGGSVLFQRIHKLQQDYPRDEIWVSVDWANAPVWVAELFLPNHWRQYRYSSLKHWTTFSPDEYQRKIFWMMASEYRWIQNSPDSKIQIVEILDSLVAPGGVPVFYAARLSYREPNASP